MGFLRAGEGAPLGSSERVPALAFAVIFCVMTVVVLLNGGGSSLLPQGRKRPVQAGAGGFLGRVLVVLS